MLWRLCGNEPRRRRQVDERAGSTLDHACDFVRELCGIAGVDRDTEAMLARQPADQAEVLRQHRPAIDRRPHQDATRADELLVGGQYDITATHERCKLGPVQATVVDAKPEVRTLPLQGLVALLEALTERRIDLAREQDGDA